MTVKINKQFVKVMLAERDITLRDLAVKADLGEATLYRVVNGAQFTSETLGKLATALGCNPVDLIDATGSTSPLVGASPVHAEVFAN